jgi:hypothetical protein
VSENSEGNDESGEFYAIYFKANKLLIKLLNFIITLFGGDIF